MSTQACPPSAVKSHTLVAAAAVVGVLAASTLGMPAASAAPKDDLFNLINQRHVSAGCRQYDPEDTLEATAVGIAQDLANNNGRRLSPPTDMILANNAYWATSLGEMDYFNPNGGSPQDAVNFWLNNPTRDIFPNCDMLAMGTGVWIVGNKWAAVALTGNAGPAPPSQERTPSHVG